VRGADRAQALRRAKVALDEMVISGVPTVLPFHRAVVRDGDFTNNEKFGVYTTWIETEFAAVLAASPEIAAAEPGGEREELTIDVDGKALRIGLPAQLLHSLLHGGGSAAQVQQDNDDAAGVEVLVAPMSGNLVKWLAEDGAELAAGDPVAVVEAMKMESTIEAHRHGTLTRGGQQPGTPIVQGEELGRIG
jgi:acetyl-CoA/propionyl-CoA carboxylase biotin carboxyl carrier protein